MFAHVGELWPLKLQRSILFWRQRNSNLSVWCHVTICVLEWRSLQISISKESPFPNFQRNLTNFLFTWLLCSSLAQSPVRLADRGAWKLSHVSKNGKIVACFQKWEDYLSADCQLEELWWVVEDREGEDWENVHPCRPQVRHLDEIVHSIVDCK